MESLGWHALEIKLVMILTHWGLTAHICIIKLDNHWLRSWLINDQPLIEKMLARLNKFHKMSVANGGHLVLAWTQYLYTSYWPGHLVSLNSPIGFPVRWYMQTGNYFLECSKFGVGFH